MDMELTTDGIKLGLIRVGTNDTFVSNMQTTQLCVAYYHQRNVDRGA